MSFIHAKPWFALTMLCLLIGLLLFSKFAMATTEEPKYNVLMSDDNIHDIELREYSGFIVAETQVSGSREDASREGFQRIADYIFGNNQLKTDPAQSTKIAMTAPVTIQVEQAKQTNPPIPSTKTSTKIAMTVPVTIQPSMNDDTVDTNVWTVHFVMPSEYSMESLPKPNNTQVKLRQVPTHTMAVIRFSGKSKEDNIRQKTEALLTWLKQHDLKPMGEPALSRYNPPWTPAFMRRNEIMIRYQSLK